MTYAIACLYALVAAACFMAASSARMKGAPARDGWHWLAFAAIFLLFVALRLTGFEEHMRDAGRRLFRAEGWYAERRMLQGPLAAIALAVAGTMAWLALRRFPGWQSRLRLPLYLARIAVLGYVPLYALRLVSLHATDRLLYAGPLRLNWLIDGGLALLCLGSAIAYVRGIRRRAADPPASRGQGNRR